MSAWAPKRFWKETAVAEDDGGYTVRLDGKPVKTPAKAPLILPTRAMAEAVAAEWQAQEGEIRPEKMPMARFAHSAIDKLTLQFDAVAEIVAAYGASDLICYRAETPERLVARQAEGWDPLIAWADEALGAPLRTGTGVIHVEQPAESLVALSRAVHDFTPFELAGLHDLVAISGSLVLGLAVARGRLTPDEAFDLSRIDEHWQAELWGHDAESAAAEALKRADHAAAADFFRLSR